MSEFLVNIAGEDVVADGFAIRDCLGCFFRAYNVEEDSHCNFYGMDIHYKYLHVGKKPLFCKAKRLYIVLEE